MRLCSLLTIHIIVIYVKASSKGVMLFGSILKVIQEKSSYTSGKIRIFLWMQKILKFHFSVIFLCLWLRVT